MPRAPANGIELEYETYGPRSARPLLLLRGLGTQLIHWHPEFCQQLADEGHFLVIFDNRDVGLSTHLPGQSYGIEDLADDVVGLMDALELATAHIAGISMGGLIVQVVACRHPARVRSMTSIMASTGNPALPGPTEEALTHLMTPAPRDRGDYVEYTVQGGRVFGSPGFPFDEAAVRELAGRVYDRAFDPEGVGRQMAAIQASGDRRAALACVSAPTLVIHGDSDPLVRPEGGRATAAAIPGAELRMIPGMGHDIPRGAWDVLAGAIGEHTRKAEARAGSS
jgi:pimeloyl-ACP methyl ester carboxylesterase